MNRLAHFRADIDNDADAVINEFARVFLSADVLPVAPLIQRYLLAGRQARWLAGWAGRRPSGTVGV